EYLSVDIHDTTREFKRKIMQKWVPFDSIL
ncbi:unnamed protein product, partial [Larinioides sclopetarius]